jgi:hypothetical protein
MSATVEVGNWLDSYSPYNTPDIWEIGQLMLMLGRPRNFFNDKTNQQIAHFETETLTRDYILNKLNWRGGPGSSCAIKPKKSN